jgi:hypothetical protein
MVIVELTVAPVATDASTPPEAEALVRAGVSMMVVVVVPVFPESDVTDDGKIVRMFFTGAAIYAP